MEFIDIVDKNGLPTGKITERKIAWFRNAWYNISQVKY